jgi:hypothetical protein
MPRTGVPDRGTDQEAGIDRFWYRAVGIVMGMNFFDHKKGLRIFSKSLLFLAGTTRLELATSGVTGGCSDFSESLNSP